MLCLMSDLYHQTPPSRSYLFADTMKRYQKLLGPIFMGLCAWGAVLGYCAKTGECGTPMREVVEPVSLCFDTDKEDNNTLLKCFEEYHVRGLRVERPLAAADV